MPSATLTVTAKAGPGDTLTAGVFTNVSNLDFNFGNNTFNFTASDGSIKTFDWQSITTVTVTVSSNNAVVSIS